MLNSDRVFFLLKSEVVMVIKSDFLEGFYFLFSFYLDRFSSIFSVSLLFEYWC